MIIPNKSKLSWTQRFTSYIFDIVLVHSPSPYPLQVILRRDKVILDSENANQSYDELQKAFHQIFLEKGIYQLSLKKILILGFGLGSIAELLFKNSSSYQITGVESDQRVLHWAVEYFNFQNIMLVPESAESIQLNDAFDLIIVDLFIDRDLPKFALYPDFWHQLRSHPETKKTIIWNTLSEHQNEIPPEIKSLFNQEIRSIYGNVFWIYQSQNT